ncbi:hypothetical protein EC968_008219 [Mortierella alpina]|nr:hypothetical protein EC968_008219 [Mortierella alpina]
MADNQQQQQQQQQRFPFLRNTSSTSDIKGRKQQQQTAPPPHSFISPAGHVDSQGTAAGNTMPPVAVRGHSIAAAMAAAAMLPHSIAVANAAAVDSASLAPNHERNSTASSSSLSSSRRAHSASISTLTSTLTLSTSASASASVATPNATTTTFTTIASSSSLSLSSSASSSSLPANGTPHSSHSSIAPTLITPPTATLAATATADLKRSSAAAAGLTRLQDGMDSTRPSSLATDPAQANPLGPGSFPVSTGSHHSNGYIYSNSNSNANGSYAYSNGAGYDSASTSQRSSRDGDTISGDDGSEAHISFVYANEKRFSDFHSLFRSVPDDEKLIEDYGCALQKEILVQGRLYISENHVCFNANIFGWVTNLVIAFSEITAIEKRLTAFVIPNAISIVTTTNTKGHFFASFLSRDAAHDLLMAAWRNSFPCAANASVAHYSNNNNNAAASSNSNSSGSSGYHRQNRSNATINDDDEYNNDAQSFISARGNTESRKNRHQRSFSNASQPWMGDDNNDNWAEDDAAVAAAAAADGKSSDGLRRKGSKRAVVKKLLKEVIAPIIPDEDQRQSSLSPSNGNKRTGRPRSVSELPPRPTSFDGAGNRGSIVAARTSLDQDSLAPVIQRARAGTESLPNRRGEPAAAGSAVSLPAAAAASAAAVSSARQSRAKAASSPSSQPPRTKTTCQCSKDGRHYANVYLSETYPGSVESLWKLLFDSQFAKGFLTSEVMKGADVQEEAWKNAPDGKSSTKVTRYIKWLGMPIGPKTTKAILTDLCEHKNFDEYVTTVTTTSTPDVPSGGSFSTKVRTCITWAGPHQVQMVVTGAVEFTKSSWIKGQIEKGAQEGMTMHYKELDRSLRKYIATHPREFPSLGGVAAASTTTGRSGKTDGSATPSPPVPGPRSTSLKEHSGERTGSPSVSFETTAASGKKDSQRSTAAAGTAAGATATTAGLAGQQAKTSVGSSLARLVSKLSKTLELEWNAHLMMVSVLAVVLLANVYIWYQISSVSSQIERIQGDGFLAGHQRHHYHHHHHPKSSSASASSSSSSTKRPPAWALDDEDFALEQEDAMWAWLTEREARHRQYRKKNVAAQYLENLLRFDADRTRKTPPPPPPTTGNRPGGLDEARIQEVEEKLQARIEELQGQLEALERQAFALQAESEGLERESNGGSTTQ